MKVEVKEDEKAMNNENHGESDENATNEADVDLGVNSPVTKRTVTNLKHWINEKVGVLNRFGLIDFVIDEFKSANWLGRYSPHRK